MKTIVVPTDFSEYALFALKVAARIAKKVNARIKLLHACNIPTTGVKEFSYYADFYKEIKINADYQLKKLMELKFLENINVEKFLIPDQLVSQVLIDAKFKNTDLIVIGSHGTSGFSSILIGSNTEKIVRIANAPVLTIKNENENFNIKKMVFASDFYEGTDAVFNKIKFLFNAYNAKLYLLKVITPSDFESTPSSFRLMNDFMVQNSLKNCSVNIYNSYSIESGIIEFSQETGADLVVIPTHGRTGFSHLINGSLAENLAVHEPKPVLSIKIPVATKPVVKVSSSDSIYENLDLF